MHFMGGGGDGITEMAPRNPDWGRRRICKTVHKERPVECTGQGPR